MNERIVEVKLKAVGGEWLTLVQVYAPTNDSGGEVKEHFYNELHREGRKERDTDNYGGPKCKSGQRL